MSDKTPPESRRAALRGPLIVTQVKMGDERKYFFGYAKNVSRAGVFIHTLAPKNVGEEFVIEFTIPKADIKVRCRCKVVWNRNYTAGGKDPGMGLAFLDLDEDTAERIHAWVAVRLKEEAAQER